MSAPTRMFALVDADELACLLALAAEMRSIKRRRDEHVARGGKDTSWAKTLPIGTVAAGCLLVEALDETQARLSRES